jgi:ribose 1,5-bisphosphokinase PhnN
MVIWVRADEEIIKERLAARRREGHLLKEPLGMYLAMKKDLREYYEADIEFENNEPLDIATEKLTRLVKERLM